MSLLQLSSSLPKVPNKIINQYVKNYKTLILSFTTASHSLDSRCLSAITWSMNFNLKNLKQNFWFSFCQKWLSDGTQFCNFFPSLLTIAYVNIITHKLAHTPTHILESLIIKNNYLHRSSLSLCSMSFPKFAAIIRLLVFACLSW